MAELIDQSFDPAGLGLRRGVRGGVGLGGGLGATWRRPPPSAVAELRELTRLPVQHAPPMPPMPAGHIGDPAVEAALREQAPLVWRAVRHRRDYPKAPAKAKAWAPRTMRAVVGAINVWKAKAPADLSLWALAAVRWDGIEEWAGSRPRKPVAVFGRANGLDLERAAAYQRDVQSLALPPTPAEKRLLAERRRVLGAMRKAAVTPDAAARMIEARRPAMLELRTTAEAERAARYRELEAARSKGDWIWTCRSAH